VAKLMPYEEYIEVDMPWLERIPSHWKQRKVKYLFDERVEKGYPDEALLAATQTKGVVPKHMYENRTVVAQKDLHLLKLVKKGDFVISLRSFQGGIEYAYYQGIISPAYTIMIPKNEIAPGYFKHIGKSRSFIELLKLCVTGIREGQNIDYNELKNSIIPLPPKEEQDQIAKFLDNRLSKINRFIKAKKKQIELLKELKQAIINQVVTKGIDPSVPMKDSGVNWVKEIPTHWKIKHTRYLWKERKETNHVEEQLLSVTINRGIIPQSELLSTTVKRDTSNLDKTKYKLVLQNDIAYNKMRMWQGAVGVSKFRGIVSPAYIVLKPIKEINYYYYHYLLRTPNYIGESYRFSYGICDDQLSLRYEDFKGMSIIVPPKEEQDQIAKFLDNRLSKINRFIKAKKKQIELLKEYRTSLISAVVTGKVDVRHIPVEDTDEFIEDMDEEEIGEGDKEVLTC
jgi:type I restriction enzyme S subunit